MNDRPLDRIPRWLRLTPLQWALVVLAALLVGGLGYALQNQKEDRYEAQARVLFRNAALDRALFQNEVFSGTADAARDAATNLRLLDSPELAEAVVKSAGLSLSPDELLGNMGVGSAGESNVANVSYTASSPGEAARIANIIAEEFVARRRAADRATVDESLRVARARVQQLRRAGDTSTAELEQFLSKLSDLEVLAAVQTGGVEIVDRAFAPAGPVTSGALQVAAGAGLLQGVLGLAVLAVYRRFRDPVDASDDLGELKLPVLAELPRVRRLAIAPGSPSSEAFDSGLRLLLGNIKFVASPGANVCAIQSARSGEGKSSIAFHLARVAARGGQRVCLVDADLRMRTLTRGLGLPQGAGLSMLLASEPSFDTPEAAQAVTEATISVEGFDLLGAGPKPPNPGDLMAREGLGALVNMLRRKYDLVVVDAPPFLVRPDAAGILPDADAVVIVVRRGARLYQVRQLVERLRILGARPAGTVLNMASSGDDSYGAYYEHGQDPGERKPRRLGKKEKKSEPSETTRA